MYSNLVKLASKSEKKICKENTLSKYKWCQSLWVKIVVQSNSVCKEHGNRHIVLTSKKLNRFFLLFFSFHKRGEDTGTQGKMSSQDWRDWKANARSCSFPEQRFMSGNCHGNYCGVEKLDCNWRIAGGSVWLLS